MARQFFWILSNVYDTVVVPEGTVGFRGLMTLHACKLQRCNLGPKQTLTVFPKKTER